MTNRPPLAAVFNARGITFTPLQLQLTQVVEARHRDQEIAMKDVDTEQDHSSAADRDVVVYDDF